MRFCYVSIGALVLDSFGRIPQAVTQGNNIDMGTYDQCVNIFENLDNGDIKGKYCYGGLILQMVDMEFKELEASDMVNIVLCFMIQLITAVFNFSCNKGSLK